MSSKESEVLERVWKTPGLLPLLVEAVRVFKLEGIDAILDGRRQKSKTAARHVVWWVLRLRWRQHSYPEIARMLGDYNHTTVISGVRKIEHEFETGSELGLLAAEVVVAFDQQQRAA